MDDSQKSMTLFEATDRVCEAISRMSPEQKALLRASLNEKMAQSDSADAEQSVRVVWEFWKAGYERSYHGEPAILDLGDIGDDPPVFPLEGEQ